MSFETGNVIKYRGQANSYLSLTATPESDVVCLACDLSGTFGVKTVRVMVPCPPGRDCAMVHFGLRCPRCGTMARKEPLEQSGSNYTVIGNNAAPFGTSGEYTAFGKGATEAADRGDIR